MARRRIEPPLGLPPVPKPAGTNRRGAKGPEEFQDKLVYVLRFFRHGLEAQAVRISLAQLRRTVAHGPTIEAPGIRVHLQIEFMINVVARQFAVERTGQADAYLIQQGVERAASLVAKTFPTGPGRRRDELLEHHAAGIMALLHHYSGLPVMSARYTGPGSMIPTCCQA